MLKKDLLELEQFLNVVIVLRLRKWVGWWKTSYNCHYREQAKRVTRVKNVIHKFLNCVKKSVDEKQFKSVITENKQKDKLVWKRYFNGGWW